MLSPLNFSGLIAAQRNPREVNPKRGSATAVMYYECDECGEHYDSEKEAQDCCAEPTPECCPVCLSEAASPRDAADCCLWKDLDAATRWRMADAVENGSTWAEQLAGYARKA